MPLRLTPALVGLLAGSTAVLHRAPPGTRERVRRACSTDVDNLGAGHWHALLTSLLVLDDEAEVRALLGLLVVLGLAETRWGPGRAGLVLVTGHVAASLGVHAGVRAARRLGRTGAGTTSVPDVGVSYGVLAVAGALAGRSPWQRAALALLVATPLMRRPTPTDAGHALAAGLGVALGVRG